LVSSFQEAWSIKPLLKMIPQLKIVGLYSPSYCHENTLVGT